MDKKEYLIKTLSRTKRKDYENYVIGAIYHKLNNPNIKPVSQQYVKRSDNSYALLDLYFPQINYAVECDEAYHLANKENDIAREISVEQKLSALTGESLIIRRVDASKDIASINVQISCIVQEILELYKSKGSPIWEDEDPVSVAISKGRITVSDNLYFRTEVDVLKLFGKNFSGFQRGTCRLNENTIVWFPHLAIETESGEMLATNAAGWINLLSSDWKTILERHETRVTREVFGETINDTRIVFAKSKNCLGENAYRFLGVYRMIKFEDNHQAVYEVFKDSLDLQLYQ